jgi:hypothetical protein
MLAQMALALDWYSDLVMVDGDGDVRDAVGLLVQAVRASRATTTDAHRRITAG